MCSAREFAQSSALVFRRVTDCTSYGLPILFHRVVCSPWFYKLSNILAAGGCRIVSPCYAMLGQTGEIRSRFGLETVAEFIGKQKERLLPDPFPLNFNLAASLQTLFAHKARSHFGQDSLHPLPLTTFPDYKTAKYTRRRRRSEPSQLLETWDRSWRSSHRSYLSLTSLP